MSFSHLVLLGVLSEVCTEYCCHTQCFSVVVSESVMMQVGYRQGVLAGLGSVPHPHSHIISHPCSLRILRYFHITSPVISRITHSYHWYSLYMHHV